MADLTVTAANVARSSGGVSNEYLAGEAITAGQSVYLKTSNSRWMKAQADGTAEEAGGSTVIGIALNTGVTAQPMTVQLGGIINPGATVTVGKVYVISATAGGICPIADITTTGHYISILGIGATTSTIDMDKAKIYATGITIP